MTGYSRLLGHPATMATMERPPTTSQSRRFKTA